MGVSVGARKKYCTRHSNACTVTMSCEAMTVGRYRRARAKYASVEFSDSGTKRAPMAYIIQIKKAPGIGLKYSNEGVDYGHDIPFCESTGPSAGT